MAKGPSVIIIARHGARLDVEDSAWQAKSSSPYDTPLTYGGWTQSRALGARIASLLHARDLAAAKNETADVTRFTDSGSVKKATRSKESNRKIFIHSSPFLRCIQTSIAIAAGMAQYQGNLIKFGEPGLLTAPMAPRLFTASERSKSSQSKDTEGLVSTNYEPTKMARPEMSPAAIPSFTKPFLRIDAFLGEWLSPEYYELITAPPPSNIMVAGAKAELLRSAEPVQGVQQNVNLELNTKLENGQAQSADSPLSLDEIENALPKPPSSFEVDGKTHSTSAMTTERGTTPAGSTIGYIPPMPNYALSTSEPIPRGYVAHARNSCIDIDLQWDSERDPQKWGDGGEYGEEWSSMHKRFRKGISEMISWYKQQLSVKLTDKIMTENASSDDQIDHTDTILVIVTHGAGCNALIGALTSQPVLMDIGMGSLTMAVRKDKLPSTTDDKLSRVISGRRRSSAVDPILTQEYEMKLTASTEHLRAGADPLKIPQLQSPRMLPSISEHKRDLNSQRSSTIMHPTSPSNEQAFSKNSALGSIRRSTVTSTTIHRPISFTPGASKPAVSPTSTGLWGSPAMAPAKKESLPALEEIPKLSDDNLDVDSDRAEKGEKVLMSQSPQIIERSSSQHGLWASRPPMERNSSRRRWTFNEH